MRSRLVRSSIVLLALLVIAELAARALLGLGNPVLYVADPAIEYMLRPGQDKQRLGKRIIVNEYGMRSESLPERKSDERELRVLVMGDSVVNGGNRIDQWQLATTVLRDRLAAKTQLPVVVGNVSAGSWGPQNMLAWSRRFGFLDADVVVMVLSSHDASDVPTFAALDATTQPTVRPLSALGEGLSVLLARYRSGANSQPSMSAEMESERRAAAAPALQAVGELARRVRNADACVTLVQHFTRTELAGRPGPGHDALRAVADELGIAATDDARKLLDAASSGAQLYRDNIHLNETGQAVLAEVLEEAVLQCLPH